MLFNRFKEYLDKQFKSIPESREANDFREELLGNLMSHAMELKEDKSLSENEIFNRCISSLGDYSGTLKKLSGNPIAALRDKRFLRDILFALTFALLSVVVYIAVSFAIKNWGLTAIIIFPSMAGILYLYFTAKIVAKNTSLNRHMFTGVILASYAVIITLAAFFISSFVKPVAVGPGKAWVLFTFIPFLTSVASAITFAFFRKSRIPAIVILAGVASLGVAAYLLVAVITGIWHPTWLIALAGPLAALIAGIIGINNRLKK